jgi:hypothetical protein
MDEDEVGSVVEERGDTMRGGGRCAGTEGTGSGIGVAAGSGEDDDGGVDADAGDGAAEEEKRATDAIRSLLVCLCMSSDRACVDVCGVWSAAIDTDAEGTRDDANSEADEKPTRG